MASSSGSIAKNCLYYGDNLDVLREHVADASIDLIYLDPPFNSNRRYSVLFKEKSGDDAQAQIEAFEDTWTWSQDAEAAYLEVMNGNAPNAVKDALEAMRRLLGDNDVLAYLVMMTTRLRELHRVLKSTGSLYLHCDPTASHYLKIMLDAIFGPTAFANEVIWKRSHAHNSASRYGRNHDVILFYRKGSQTTWNQVYQDYDAEYVAKHYKHVDPATGRRYKRENPTGAGTRTGATGQPWRGIDPTAKGRHWAKTPAEMDRLDAEGRIYWPNKPGSWPYLIQYLDDMPGVPGQDLWLDIDPINMIAAERLGYPTQKPLALLERIVLASSNPGDVVLDPFAGCGTAVDAAQKLGRRWIGIDVTTLAIDLIDARLRHTYSEEIRATYEIRGIPRDRAGAEALFRQSAFEFERWCVMELDGQPNEKQVGDRGVDGVIRFPLNAQGDSDRILVSVKGGATNPGHVRDLIGTVKSQRAAMGVFVTMNEPTRGMLEAANHSGSYVHPANAQHFPKVQIVTVKELLEDKRPRMPLTLLPYFQAQRRYGEEQTARLF